MRLSVISIRQLEEGDVPALRHLVAEMQEFERTIEPRLLLGDAMAAAYTQVMLRRCGEQDGVVLVATDGGDPIGFVAVACAVPVDEPDEPPGTHALVTDLVVTASHRGRGLGRMLLEHAARHARSRGATELRVELLSENATAESLYRSAGFRPYLATLRKDLGEV